MCLEIEPEQLALLVGHDGSEVIWPHLKSPYCYKGVTIPEINLALKPYGLHFGTTMAKPVVSMGNGMDRLVFEDPVTAFNNAVASIRGIVIGINGSGVMHAVARTSGGDIFDPLHNPSEMEIAYYHPLCSYTNSVKTFHNKLWANIN
jgi:hypothetical protein